MAGLTFIILKKKKKARMDLSAHPRFFIHFRQGNALKTAYFP